MRWQEIGDLDCSIARTLSVVGERWTLLILRDCFLGARRFDQFEASLGISPHLLSSRINKLVEHDVLERRVYSERPLRHEYRLTHRGRDLYPVIVSLLRWGDRWMSDAAGPPVQLVHKQCNRAMTPNLSCPECAEPITARDVSVRFRRGLESPSTTRR